MKRALKDNQEAFAGQVLSEESKISWQLEVGCQHFLKSWEPGLDSWMSFSRVVW